MNKIIQIPKTTQGRQKSKQGTEKFEHGIRSVKTKEKELVDYFETMIMDKLCITETKEKGKGEL